jgi:hypothetical protein
MVWVLLFGIVSATKWDMWLPHARALPARVAQTGTSTKRKTGLQHALLLLLRMQLERHVGAGICKPKVCKKSGKCELHYTLAISRWHGEALIR